MNIGDRVRIREDLEVGKTYDFVENMEQYRGMEATIIKKTKSGKCMLDVDGGFWTWYSEMFVGGKMPNKKEVQIDEILESMVVTLKLLQDYYEIPELSAIEKYDSHRIIDNLIEMAIDITSEEDLIEALKRKLPSNPGDTIRYIVVDGFYDQVAEFSSILEAMVYTWTHPLTYVVKKEEFDWQNEIRQKHRNS